MKPTEIIIHHQLPPFPTDKPQFEAINTYHKERFNFKSSLGYFCGYTYVIEKNGTVIQARLDTEEGAHTLKHNKGSIGICLALNGDVEWPAEAQFEALRVLIRQKVSQYQIPFQNVTYHRKWAPYKSCPGKLLTQEWLEKNVLGQDIVQLEKDISFIQKVINNLTALIQKKKE